MNEVIVLKEEHPVARKTHICDLCGGIINTGEKYIRQHNKMEDVYIFKMHEQCQIASSILDRRCDIECYDPIDLMSIDLKENAIQVPALNSQIVEQYIKQFQNV